MQAGAEAGNTGNADPAPPLIFTFISVWLTGVNNREFSAQDLNIIGTNFRLRKISKYFNFMLIAITFIAGYKFRGK